MIHSGILETTRAHLSFTKPAAPTGAGSKWQGIAHGTLIAELEKAMAARKMNPTWAEFATNKSQTDLVAHYMFPSLPGVPALTQDYFRYVLGVSTSTSRRRQFRLYVGAGQYVAKVGFIVSEVARKHTIGFDLLQELPQLLDQWQADLTLVRGAELTMQKSVVPPHQLPDLLLRAARRGLLAWSRLRVMDECLQKLLSSQGPKALTAFAVSMAYSKAIQAQPATDQQMLLLEFNRYLYDELMLKL